MKGDVFLAMSEMIQGMYGHKAWNDFLIDSKVESQGIYTSAEIYEDKEASQLLSSISKKLNKRQSDVLYVFGLYLIKYFKRKYPAYFEHEDFVSFMISVESVVHVEIEKITTNCNPPKINVLDINKDEFTIHYYSKRRLCRLAHGLISGAAKIYKKETIINHTACMHDGHDYCIFEIQYK